MPEKNALQRFIDETRAHWGPLDSALVTGCRARLAALAQTPASEPWVASLHERQPATEELYRDPEHGFVLLAHTEPEGLYRAPHDHGQSWVVYAPQRGAIVMTTYARIEDARGVRLVERDQTVLRAGQAQVFLPGDIHDTRAVAGPALLFRFTERDLELEKRIDGRLTRYVARDGVWTVGP